MVWTGNDDNSKVKSNESKISKKIWANTIVNIKDNTKTWYEIPDGITLDLIDPYTGLSKNNGYICYFENGSEPSFNKLFKDTFLN
jgi:hypothetical protein